MELIQTHNDRQALTTAFDIASREVALNALNLTGISTEAFSAKGVERSTLETLEGRGLFTHWEKSGVTYWQLTPTGATLACHLRS